jgi:acylphosphatase
MLVARRFVLSGRVQGVGFRYFAEEAAAVEGVSGWIRNLADGRVEAFARGDREAVERFERKLRRGPAGARVEDVTTTDEEADADAPPGFRIRAS